MGGLRQEVEADDVLFSFMKGRTTDATFINGQLQEKTMEKKDDVLCIKIYGVGGRHTTGFLETDEEGC